MKKIIGKLVELNILCHIVVLLISLILGYTIWYAVLYGITEKNLYTLEIEVIERQENDNPFSEVWIEEMQFNGYTDLGDIFGMVKSNGFEFRKASDYGYTCDVIVNTSGIGSTFSAQWNGNNDFSMVIWKQEFSALLSVSLYENDKLKESFTVDLYDNTGEERYKYNADVNNVLNFCPVYVNILLTLIIGAIIYAAIILIVCKIKERITERSQFRNHIYIYIYSLVICLTLTSCLIPVIKKIAAIINMHMAVSEAFFPFYSFCSSVFAVMEIDIPSNGVALYFTLIVLFVFAILLYVISLMIDLCIKSKWIAVSSRPTEKERFIGVDIIKAVGVVFVIIIHIYKELGFYTRSMTDMVMLPLSIGYTLLLTCVPLFITMTGFLMRNKQVCLAHYIGWFKYYFIYVLIELTLKLYFYFKGTISLQDVLKSISPSEQGYVSMFAGLYFMIPFLNKIYDGLELKHKGQLILVLLSLSFLPSVSGLLFTRYWIALGALCYYFTGALFRDYMIKIRKRVCIIGIILFAVFETIYIYFFSGEQFNRNFFWNTFNNFENTYYILPTFLLTFLLTALIINIKNIQPKLNFCIKKLSVHSFELYLLGWTVQGEIFGFARQYIDIDQFIFLYSFVLGIIEFVIIFLVGSTIRKIGEALYRSVFKSYICQNK